MAVYTQPPERQNGEPAVQYGGRLLCYVLEHGEVYGLLTDEQLEAAAYSAHVAVIAKEILPQAVNRVSAIRHAIAATLRRRREERQAAIEALSATQSVPPDSHPTGGRHAPLKPRIPGLPPEGAYADDPAGLGDSKPAGAGIRF
jgi:hypothetical protein